jgi:transcription elongation GreA/GreB family factor
MAKYQEEAPRRVGIGSRLTILDAYGRAELIIVPSSAELTDNRHVSVSSPLAKALLGRQTGEEVLLQTPAGPYRVRVLHVC